MTEMIERVARAIHADFYATRKPELAFEDQRQLWLSQARAAIVAMREPAEEMRAAWRGDLEPEMHIGWDVGIRAALGA